MTGINNNGAVGLAAIRTVGGLVLDQFSDSDAADNTPIESLKTVPDVIKVRKSSRVQFMGYRTSAIKIKRYKFY